MCLRWESIQSSLVRGGHETPYSVTSFAQSKAHQTPNWDFNISTRYSSTVDGNGISWKCLTLAAFPISPCCHSCFYTRNELWQGDDTHKSCVGMWVNLSKRSNFLLKIILMLPLWDKKHSNFQHNVVYNAWEKLSPGLDQRSSITFYCFCGEGSRLIS